MEEQILGKRKHLVVLAARRKCIPTSQKFAKALRHAGDMLIELDRTKQLLHREQRSWEASKERQNIGAKGRIGRK